MKVLHVIPSLSPKHGGPSFALPLMARSLSAADVKVDVATTDDDGPGGRLSVPLEQPVERDGARYFHFRKQTEFYKFSWPLRRWLSKRISDYGLIHIHALFSYASVCAARIARRQRVPYVIRPLGVLNHWGMVHRHPLLKRFSFRFIEGPILRHAAAIHYTSEQERIEAECVGVTTRPFVVPLGLDLAPFQALPGPKRFFKRWPQAVGREIVLFLSRLDPIKGLDLLIDAFAEVKQRRGDALLVIAGDGEERFGRGLRERTEKRGIASDVVWTGFLGGANKLSALAAANVFVLPSYSENFGIAAVEALAAGVPTVVTRGVGIAGEIQQAYAGIVVAPRTRDLAKALLQVLEEPELAQRLRTNGRKLARERYSLEAMGDSLARLYRETLVTRQSTAH